MTRMLACALASLLLAGCSESGPEVVAVRGKITFNGGDWPEPSASAYFTPISTSNDLPIIPAMAELERDGSFTVDSTAGAGLVPGVYRVRVECWKLPPDESRAENPLGISHVPKKYRDPSTSDLEFTLESGKPLTDLKLDVPAK